MAARGMGPTAFAEHVGIPRTKLTAWQSSASRPQPDSIRQLAPRLGTSIVELLIEAEHFTADELGVEHLPADPANLDDEQLLAELRRRLALARVDLGPGAADDEAIAASHEAGGVFPGARRGRRPGRRLPAVPASDAETRQPANGDGTR